MSKRKAVPHRHEAATYCICRMTPPELHDECPQHGWPLRLNCIKCGQFMSVRKYIRQEQGK